MEQIVIEPLRVLKLTHTKESVLVTKEDNFNQDEWVKLKGKVEKIAQTFREPVVVDVELNTVLDRSYISVKDHRFSDKRDEENVMGMTLKDMGFGISYDGDVDTWEELAKVLEVELMIEGYSVKRTLPDTTTFIQRRLAEGKPVVAKFLLEEDCITIGVSDIFQSNLPTIDVDVVIEDINGALKAINDMLLTLSEIGLPEGWKTRPEKKAVCKMGHTVSGAHVYGVAELKLKTLKTEELTMGARAAKSYLQLLGYKVEAERAVRVVTPLDL